MDNNSRKAHKKYNMNTCGKKAFLQISELFASLGQNAIDYAFRLTGIPKFKFMNSDYNGL